MREKNVESILITVVLAAFLIELLNITNSALANSKFLNTIANVFIILVISAFWTLLVVIRRKKKYNYDKTTTEARMKLVEFDDIYNRLCAEHRNYLEKKRRTQRDRKLIVQVSMAIIVACLIGGLFFASTGGYECTANLAMLLVVAIVVFSAAVATSKERIEEYRAAYKLRIISNLLKNISNGLEYTYADDETDLWQEFNIAEFGLMEPNVIDYIDKIVGTIEGNPVEMLELNLADEIRNESGENIKTRILNGMFAKVDLNKNEDFILKVCSVGVSSRVGAIEPRCKKMKLDNTKFMDNFIIETNNRMLAMRILTSEIMEKFTNYKLKYGVVFDLVIRNGKMYFLFYTGDMFEPDIFVDSMKKDLLLKDYSMLKLIVDLIRQMNMIMAQI